MQSTDLVTRLYQAVDSRTAASLEPFLSPSVTFQLGNNLPVSGKEAVLQVNASFFDVLAPECCQDVEGTEAEGCEGLCYTGLEQLP